MFGPFLFVAAKLGLMMFGTTMVLILEMPDVPFV